MSKKTIFLKGLLFGAIIFILADIAFLNWKTLGGEQAVQKDEESSFISYPTPTLTPSIYKTEETSPSAEKSSEQALSDEVCPQACLLEIDKATNASSQKTASTPTPSASSAMKIYYLPLGSGSTKSQDWADISGLSTYIDPATYGKIKSVIFEASLRIPTANGKIYARLYNKNDGRPVWFSEVSSEGATSILIQSQPISFESGNKLYQVQAKTSMGFESFVDFARIKFITD